MATIRRRRTVKKGAVNRKAKFRGQRSAGGSTGTLSNRVDPPSNVIRASGLNYKYEDFAGGLLPVHPVLGRVVSTDDATKGLATVEFTGNVANVEIQCHLMNDIIVRNGDPVLVVFYTDQPNSGVVIGVLERGPRRMMVTTDGVGARHNWILDASGDNLAFIRDGNTWLNINNVGVLDIISGKLNLSGIPTSSAGLVAGDVWKNGTVLNIV